MNKVIINGDGIVLHPSETSGSRCRLAAQSLADTSSGLSATSALPAFDGCSITHHATQGDGEAGANACKASAIAFTIWEPETASSLGGVDLRRFDAARRQAEIDYCVLSHEGRPVIASAAVGALAAWAHDNDIDRLEIFANKENPERVRVALASGFSVEGVRRKAGTTSDGHRHDLVALVRLADDPAGPVTRALPDLPDGKLTDGDIDVRPLRPTDADDYFALQRLPDVAQSHLGETISKESAAARCNTAECRWLIGEMADCVIAHSATQEFAGTIQLINREPMAKTMMLGYALQPTSRGKGIATRAVNLLSDWAFSIGAARIVAGTFPENHKSRSVLQRAGFTVEAVIKAALPGPDGSRVNNVQLARIAPYLQEQDTR